MCCKYTWSLPGAAMCTSFPPQWPSGAHTRKEEHRVDQCTSAKTLTKACTITHDLIQNAFLKQHRGSFYTEEMLHYRPLTHFSPLYHNTKSHTENNADINAKCDCTSVSFSSVFSWWIIEFIDNNRTLFVFFVTNSSCVHRCRIRSSGWFSVFAMYSVLYW